MKSQKAKKLIEEICHTSRQLSDALDELTFSKPVEVTYNPFNYAWDPYKDYIEKFASDQKDILFLGMNPGPFGMMQTGIPFGEIRAVRDWLGIEGMVNKPEIEHEKRPIVGWECERSEVSGRRLWGLFEEKFETPEKFFKNHFVMNYCPLGFLSATGSNITPDKIPKSEMQPVIEKCDAHLKEICEALKIKTAIGIGAYAKKRLDKTLVNSAIKTGVILHPSPASPKANKDWAGTAVNQMKEQGIW